MPSQNHCQLKGRRHLFIRNICLLLLCIASALAAYPQCLQGLGTPLIKETFGAGTNQFGPALPNGVTNMMWINDQCPEDGQYAITNFTTGCYGEWHTLTDHTGDPGGYFMLIDASFAPSDFFVQTVNGLCDGTTYEFAAYVVNMFQINGGIEPDITFTIEKTDGTVLSTFESGSIPISIPAFWRKEAFDFKTPPGVSTVVLRMHNNAPGGQGNDLALDDITFTPTGPKTTIAINGTQNNFIETQCVNQTALSSTVENCYVNNAFQWQISTDKTTFTDIAGANSATYTPSLSTLGTFYYRLTVAESGNLGNVNCRVNSDTLSVTYDGPYFAHTNAAICSDRSYLLPSGKPVNTAGIHLDTLRNKQGCDSLITTVNLSVNPITTSIVITSICQGQTYSGHSTTGIFKDTLQAAGGCDSIRTVNLTVIKSSSSSQNVAICNGDSYMGHTRSGTYFDTLKSVGGCDSLVTTNLTVNPEVTLGPDKTLCAGDSIILNPGAFKNYLWQDGTTTAIYKVTKGGLYWVRVTDINGCSAADTVAIKDVSCFLGKIPDTFTPNGDGINDTWNIDGLQGYPQCTVYIYSRWGQLVFKSNGYDRPWDGRYNSKQLPFGTYYYVINLKNNSLPISGYITIIR